MNKRKAFLTVCILLLAGSVMGLAFGSVNIPVGDAVNGLFSGEGKYGTIIRALRLPRVLGAVLSGAALSVSGVLLQAATGNTLASPNVIGVHAGAGFAVMAVLCFLPDLYMILPLGAFLGALAATFLVLGICRVSDGYQKRTTLLLAGIAVGTLLNAGIAFLSQLFPDVLSSYIYFSNGGFNGVYMKDLGLPAVLILGGLIGAELLGHRLNLLGLGNDLASSMGVAVKGVRTAALVLAALLCAGSVSYAGLLGFVGLMVPHIARKLIGNDQRVLIPFAALCGSLLVVLADLAGRVLFAPAELSAGILLSVLGAPFFVFLLIRRNRL